MKEDKIFPRQSEDPNVRMYYFFAQNFLLPFTALPARSISRRMLNVKTVDTSIMYIQLVLTSIQRDVYPYNKENFAL